MNILSFLFMSIYFFWGAPSQGKSYIVTLRAVKELLKAHKGQKAKKVFSNYPIMYVVPLSIFQKVKNIFRKLLKKELIKPVTLSSYQWDDQKNEYFETGLFKSMIILDEGYKIKGLGTHDKITPEQHSFFASNGKDGNDIYLIAHHYIRYNLTIREMAEYLVSVSKISNPLSRVGSGKRENQLTPLFFTTETYLTEEDFKFRYLSKGKTCFKTERILFNKKMAEAYDTKYFGGKTNKILVRKWNDIYLNPECKGELIQKNEEIEDKETVEDYLKNQKEEEMIREFTQ